MIRILYIFPAVMFALSALSIYVIFAMFQDPQTANYPKLAIFTTVLAISASFYEFYRGMKMLREIHQTIKAGEDK